MTAPQAEEGDSDGRVGASPRPQCGWAVQSIAPWVDTAVGVESKVRQKSIRAACAVRDPMVDGIFVSNALA